LTAKFDAERPDRFEENHGALARKDEMRAVFDDRALLQKWLDVEVALAQAEAANGALPAPAPSLHLFADNLTSRR
jgi:adenylosuccinate lyase